MTGRCPRFITVLLLGACSTAVAQRPATTQMVATRTLERRVDSLFAREIRSDGPGCAVGVYRNGQTVLTRGYGLADVEARRRITPTTTFNLGSVAKPFNALATLMLEQRGRLSLDDDIRRWIPELPEYGRPIRVRYRWTLLGDGLARWEQAFSLDGEASWETNWVMELRRVDAGA